MNKVFGIGMFKTGTTTLGSVFERLGYKTLNGPWWPKDIMIVDDWYERPNEWINYKNAISDITKQYDAFQDYPWMFCFDICYDLYPDAKFILTTRDSNKVANSDINMWIKNGANKNDIPCKSKFIKRYEDQYKRAIDFFSDKNDSLLIVNFEDGDGWKKICEFVGKPVPNISFPHKNKGVYR